MKVDFYRGGNKASVNDNNKKRKGKLKVWQTTLIKIGIYAVIAAIASVSFLVYFDSSFLSETMPTQGTVVNTKIKGIPADVDYLAFSYDKKYYVYLKDGVIYVKDAKTNAVKTEIKETIPISACYLVEDRNLITYFIVEKGRVGKASSSKTSSKSSSKSTSNSASKTSSLSSVKTTAIISSGSSSNHIADPNDENYKSSSETRSSASSSKSSSVPDITYINPDTVRIKTYNIDEDKKTNHQDFEVKSGSKIKDVQFSKQSNLILVNMVSGSGSKIANDVYCIDVVKYVQHITAGKIVDKMVVLNNSKTYYIYQTESGTIYKNDSVVPAFKGKKVKLLGCNALDDIYVQSNDDPSKIFILKSADLMNSKAQLETITLSDSRIKYFHFNRFGIYAVYNDYIINVAGNIQKKAMLNNNQTFVDTVDNRIYMKDSAGEISYLVENI